MNSLFKRSVINNQQEKNCSTEEMSRTLNVICDCLCEKPENFNISNIYYKLLMFTNRYHLVLYSQVTMFIYSLYAENIKSQKIRRDKGKGKKDSLKNRHERDEREIYNRADIICDRILMNLSSLLEYTNCVEQNCNKQKQFLDDIFSYFAACELPETLKNTRKT